MNEFDAFYRPALSNDLKRCITFCTLQLNRSVYTSVFFSAMPNCRSYLWIYCRVSRLPARQLIIG